MKEKKKKEVFSNEILDKKMNFAMLLNVFEHFARLYR
jgi:hypothetical protein